MTKLSLIAAAAIVAACGAEPSGAQPMAGTPAPLETRKANTDYKPAFAEQTRAPLATTDAAFEVRTVASGLQRPWGLAFLPDGRMLVTEKGGAMRIVTADGNISEPVKGIPAVDARGQGGLLDVIVGPDGWVYWSYAEPREGGNGTAVARGRLNDGAMSDVKVLWRMTPTYNGDKHYGSRLVLSGGHLFITTGERSDLEGRRQAQDLGSSFGKVIRIRPDGTVPEDNPYVGVAGAQPEIWSIGHRNIQSAAINPATGELWTVEHGPRGGDEVNIPRAGKDYGWPSINYGIEYGGGKISDGATARDGMEQPVYYWDPVIAPSGMAFYDAALFPAWKGSVFVGGMKDKDLVRLTLDGDKVVGEERLLKDVGQRIRDVRVGPDGAVYVLTDGGGLLKLVPKG